ncbi:MAG: DUF3160 domain-containing protein [Myxococcota bacterium]
MERGLHGATLRQKLPDAKDPLRSSDLYHEWLALIRTLATVSPSAATARLDFSANDAWQDRILSSALGGYAQLKHDSVLYAFEDFSAECDGGFGIMVFVEQPILPLPRGFVEPNPAFFRAAAALARRAYALFAPDGEPSITIAFDDQGGEVTSNGRLVAERLATMAEREVQGQALSDDDYAWLRKIGSTYEALFFTQQKSPSPAFGADEGRLARGIALVTTIHTNVTSGEALHIGIGRVDDVFVAVPDVVGARMTQGGLFSFYEFAHDASDRLTDEQGTTSLRQDLASGRRGRRASSRPAV